MHKINMKKACLESVKIVLLCLCIFACTDFSVNPKQKEIKRPYDDMEYLFFTNISLYATVLTSVVGIVYRLTDRLKRLFEVLLSLSPVCNSVTTVVFWGLYFTKRSHIKAEEHLVPGYETWLITELSLHLFPVVLSYLEQIDVELVFSKIYYLVFVGIIIVWGTAVHIAKEYKGVFLYGFLNKYNIFERLLFFLSVFGACLFFYHMLILINHRCAMYTKRR